ncbi:MAG: ATP phosphoribosyltransferase regulatory subunit [Proteobacteria bacterium]|nr:ATP phosphoribosyltransferase regulatory subunit [Pseudomonadota bacterium]
MIQPTDAALLPAGLSDSLPPDAAFEAEIREKLVASFALRGYERVNPPLVEFEEGLLAGTGAAMTGQTFRLMDPVSQRMMGLRADMTPQVARIASTRLAHAPRPLRLCYAGEVLRVRGSQLRPERQFAQAGCELIGGAAADADAEAVALAVDALFDIGISDVAVDIGMPTLVPAVMTDLGISGDAAQAFRAALDRKDAAEVKSLSKELGTDAKGLLAALLAASGDARSQIPSIGKLPLGKLAALEREKLLQVVARVGQQKPDLPLTVDAVENRGFEYHTGATFTIFAPGVRGELGSGGRYQAGRNEASDGEPATGFTLFLDSILRAMPPPASKPKLYAPQGTGSELLARLRADGFRTLSALGADAADIKAEARRLGCDHILVDGTPVPLGKH